MPTLWLRFAEETSVCPACASSRTQPIDAFPIPRVNKYRRVAFATGCHECGLLFANPMPAAEALEQFYSETGHWAARRADRTERLEAAYAGHLPQTDVVKAPKRSRRDVLFDAMAPHVPVYSPPPGAAVLDFGCGDGKVLDWLQARGWQTFGIEPSASVAFHRHMRLDTPPQDARFDFVILHHVLEHLAAPLELLRQLAGATREGGVLFISVPRLDTLPQHRDFRYCINSRTHPVSFSEACLSGLLARTGFAVAARLDAPELDQQLSDGKPLRMRLVATRTPRPVPLPDAPLEAAAAALAAYRRTGPVSRLQALLPVRMRAALINWSRR
jgi:SAM-dependent methyltransferase